MSEMAKKARSAMRDKAKSMTSEKVGKVDASDYVAPEPIKADIKTGLRPISRRAFKKGGKVVGEMPKARADRKPRKSGGEASKYANAKINRDVKAANEEREGEKQVGALKSGGRAKKNSGGLMAGLMGGLGAAAATGAFDGKDEKDGKKSGGRAKRANGGRGPTPQQRDYAKEKTDQLNRMVPQEYRNRLEDAQKGMSEPQPEDLLDRDQTERLERGYKKGGRMKRKDGGRTFFGPADNLEGKKGVSESEMASLEKRQNNSNKATRAKAQNYKSGGRTCKADGGPMDPVDPRAAAQGMMLKAAQRANVPANMMNFTRTKAGRLSPLQAIKTGGKVKKHDDEAQDKALFKKMMKEEERKEDKGSRTGKFYGGAMMGGGLPPQAQAMLPQQAMGGMGGGNMPPLPPQAMGAMAGGNMPALPAQAMQNAGSMAQGRPFRASGGKTRSKKGKTNINIVIATGGKPQDPSMMPGGGMPPPDAAPAGIPVPVPPPGGAGAPGAAPMPMPIPMPMPMMGGAGGPPMPRKSGGRAMTAGAGSGEGRLQKTEVAKANRPARKSGGKTFQSFKDMKAGAGSGEGRLEKTVIQAHKA